MIEYKIIASSDHDYFVKLINLQIQRGWLPQGGVAVVEHIGKPIKYFQAMMIEENEDL